MSDLESGKRCEIISLSDLINEYDRNVVFGILGSFRSYRESATESFLKEKAVYMEMRDLSRTYLAISTGDPKVLGCITIGIKCMRVPDENLLSGKTLKSMNIDSRTSIVQSYLIGQLSRSVDAPKGLGSYLLDIAFNKLRQAKILIGCRIVRLDCHDELIPYYSNHGFKIITTNDDRSLNQMMTTISSS